MQLRIHMSRNSRFLLRVGSDAIIEHCEGLEIGSWLGSSSEGADVTPVMPLDESVNNLFPIIPCALFSHSFFGKVQTRSVRPLTVKDFSHLRSGPSPNWRRMNEEEVKEPIELCRNIFSAVGRTNVEAKGVDVRLVLGALLPDCANQFSGAG
jgi:hypothetical protein